ncbi:MAG: metal ABC transporter permease [Verrucomicrobia bacterium]|nr:metal ABC transporter permease [Verrucomicrobiota bacterium]
MMESILSLFTQFPEAMAAGILVSTVCALFGVFVILKHAVFIGITLSEVAACGVAAAFLLGIPPFAGSTVLVLAAVSVMAYPLEKQRIPRDTLMGVIFIAASALSVLLVSKSGTGLAEVRSLLYGDLILASGSDLVVLFLVLIPALLVFLLFFRPVLYTFLDRDAARVLGIKTFVWEALFFIVLGLIISATSRIAGALLIFCYLVVSPATAMILSKRLKRVLIISPLMAAASTLAGMVASFHYDLPTNQTICMVSCILFICSAAVSALIKRVQR